MDIIGHKKQIEFLKKSVEKNRFSQSYIFSGPEGVGKFLIAKNFARNVVFEENIFDANVDERMGISSNFIFLEPQRKEKKGIVKVSEIKIDEVREIQKKLSTFPSQGRFNVLIVRDAHKMNQSSQNALLKIMEEPNSSSVIILVTHEEGKMLSTIKSRCHTIRFGMVSLAEIESSFRENGYENSNELSFFSMGRPGLAVELGSDSEKLLEMKKQYQDFKRILSSTISEKIEWSERAAKNVSDTVKKLEVWIWFLRIQGYKGMSDPKRLRLVYAVISRIQEALEKMRNTNSNSRLVLENLLINM